MLRRKVLKRFGDHRMYRGNTGIALALIAAVRSYKLIKHAGNNEYRTTESLKALGAERSIAGHRGKVFVDRSFPGYFSDLACIVRFI
jgi:hypothetical protein